jgi:hypothetical protein
MTSEREAYVYLQLPDTLETVPAALLRAQTLPDNTWIGVSAKDIEHIAPTILSECFFFAGRPDARGRAIAFDCLRNRTN